jgi:curved DNA-binding protein
MRSSTAMTAGEAFAVLGLSGPASPEAVKTAFNAAAKAARPDHDGGDEERFRKVIEAYRVLKKLEAARAALAPPKVEAKPTVPALEITIGEALNGLKRPVRLPDGRDISVKLPAGLRSGETVRLKGKGADGSDVELRVRIAAEPNRTVVGDDVWLTVPVEPRVLRDGARVEVETPTGPVNVWVPKSFPTEGRLRLKGEGLPARAGRPQGHMFLKFVPAEPDEGKARSMLSKFASAWTGAARTASRL